MPRAKTLFLFGAFFVVLILKCVGCATARPTAKKEHAAPSDRAGQTATAGEYLYEAEIDPNRALYIKHNGLRTHVKVVLREGKRIISLEIVDLNGDGSADAFGKKDVVLENTKDGTNKEYGIHVFRGPEYIKFLVALFKEQGIVGELEGPELTQADIGLIHYMQFGFSASKAVGDSTVELLNIYLAFGDKLIKHAREAPRGRENEMPAMLMAEMEGIASSMDLSTLDCRYLTRVCEEKKEEKRWGER